MEGISIDFFVSKVLVVGPVECRRGVLLLEQHNLEILGGEIDSLLVPNANENILAEML
jgi:RecQ-mediated genome instability protein 1